MSPVAVRRLVLAVCVVGIAGMIVSSILDRSGAATTFGLVTAVAVLCSVVATSVGRGAGTADPESLAERVEERVGRLVAEGADEHTVRQLVREAVRLGKAGSGS